MTGAQESVQEIASKNPPLVTRKEEIEGLVRQREEIRRNRMEILEEATRERVNVQHKINTYQKRADGQKKNYEDAEALATAHEERLKEAMADARVICSKEQADLSKGRSKKKLETMITALEKALRERERQVGGSSEEIHDRMQAAKRAYDENRTLINDLKQCLKVRHAAPWYWPIGRTDDLSTGHATGSRDPDGPMDRFQTPHRCPVPHAFRKASAHSRL